MYAPRPEPRPLTPLADLLTDALLLCYRRPLPFVAAAGAGAFVPAFLGWLLAPETGAALSLWRVGESALAVGLFAPTLYLIARANRGESPSVGAAVAGLLAFGPRLFVIGLVVGVAAAPLAFPFDTALPADPEPSGGAVATPAGGTVAADAGAGGSADAGAPTADETGTPAPGGAEEEQRLALPFMLLVLLPVVIYGIVRIMLASAVVVLEDARPFAAMSRSWELVRGRWLRTFALLALLAVFTSALAALFGAAAGFAGGGFLLVVATAFAQGVAFPLQAAVEVRLFEDYRAASDAGQPPGLLPGEE